MRAFLALVIVAFVLLSALADRGVSPQRTADKVSIISNGAILR